MCACTRCPVPLPLLVLSNAIKTLVVKLLFVKSGKWILMGQQYVRN